jgi:16S rRNA A1518/A1519 N6-dimethyltransferase RsmA/KsgA/DIM1 with predicted DNA glycosylase/AP lyase activity
MPGARSRPLDGQAAGAERRDAGILSAMRPSRQGSGRPRRPSAASSDGSSPRSAPFRRKSLGQHHLKSGRTCRPLIDFLRLEADDRVLEIGPGGGVLTRELLQTGARVVALELDAAWAFELPKRAATFLDRDSTNSREGPGSEGDENEETKKLRLGERRKAGGPESPAAAEQPASPDSRQGPTPRRAALTVETDVFPFNESFSAFRRSGFQLSILLGDALEFPWDRLDPSWRIAGNLPYNVGTVIVERLLKGARPGTRAAFLLQREVVDRIVARPGEEAYGALSVLVAARARAVRLGLVKPGAFVPPPKVESALVGLETFAPALSEAEMAGFERVVQAAFGQRRKSLRNALAAVYGRDDAASMLLAAGVDPRRRAEELALEEFLRLSRAAISAGGD